MLSRPVERAGCGVLSAVVGLALGACASPPAPVSAPARPDLVSAAPTADSPAARRLGVVDFVLAPSGSGSYAGWQLRVASAERGGGSLIPFTSASMNAGNSLRVELWPDRYRLQVLLRGNVEMDRWVVVASEAATEVHVDIGFLSNNISVREQQPLGPPLGVVRPVAQSFRSSAVGQALPPATSTPARQPRAAAPVASAAAAPSSSPVPNKAVDGCVKVQGEFSADAGLSRLTLDGAGKGGLRQRTTGGSDVYGFEVPFSYLGSRDAMAFDYGQAIYRDAAGKVLSRRQIKGGRVACHYDGTRLNINGKVYVRE